MAETTTYSTEMTREETANYLRSIADELGSSGGRVRVPVGNKAVHLSPSDSIESEATVTERSRRLRKDTEEMVLKFKWNPVKDTAESSYGSESTQDAEPGRESESRTESEPEQASEPERESELQPEPESGTGTESRTDDETDR